MAERRRKGWREGAHVVANMMIVALFLFPLAWMFLGAFKAQGDLLSPTPVWFFTPTLEHWQFIFENWNVERHMVNSVIVSVLTTLLTLALGLPAAYGLARFPIAGKDAITFEILSLKMIPPIAAVVPLFVLTRQVGLYNTLTVLVLLNTAFQLPFAILVLKSFVEEIPSEIDEAARVDGCGSFGVLWRAILPLSVPGLICCAVFVFIFSWNEFMIANTLVGGDLRPLPPIVGLALTHRGILWGPALALGVVVLLPVLALTFALSRYMARGLTFGAVKG
ncbi:carbohydrate ABC transporter permease [Bosea sp. 117]|uniref:carbohydrate ABC transporter permease n=1 Tax=Bosea sp. 117 TaxID=1125973 RepID=UPI0004945E1D|nr:carbohydrate ABC transporter permease [Bosea sp. 117]